MEFVLTVKVQMTEDQARDYAEENGLDLLPVQPVREDVVSFLQAGMDEWVKGQAGVPIMVATVSA